MFFKKISFHLIFCFRLQFLIIYIISGQEFLTIIQQQRNMPCAQIVCLLIVLLGTNFSWLLLPCCWVACCTPSSWLLPSIQPGLPSTAFPKCGTVTHYYHQSWYHSLYILNYGKSRHRRRPRRASPSPILCPQSNLSTYL